MYTNKIFASNGSDLDPAICAIIIGALQFLTSCAVPFIIDKLGRKVLLIFGTGGMAIAQVW